MTHGVGRDQATNGAANNEGNEAYRYVLSLRIWHPSADPVEISRALDREPEVAWMAGGERRNSKGRLLKGLAKETYWASGTIAEGSWPPRDLDEAVRDLLGSLAPHRSFLHDIRAGQGAAELFIGWFFNRQSGTVFSQETMALATVLKIDLSLDIYPANTPLFEEMPPAAATQVRPK